MPLKITPPEEQIKVETVKVLIDGDPGLGKTSISFSASRPLLLDCDNGSYRSAFRKDVVMVNSWTDISEITSDDLAGYDTVIVDTVGRALDFLTAHIIEENPKMGNNGAPSLQGWGQLKSRFAQWIKNLNTMGKDVVLIAHSKEDKRGDETVWRPDIQGGSYGEVFKIVDCAGHMYVNGKQTVLDFNPTDRWEGKNVAALDPIAIPDLRQEPEFMAGLLTKMKDAMNEMSVEGKMIAEQVAAIREEATKCETAEGFNALVEKVATLPESARPASKRVIYDSAIANGFTYDKESASFVAAEGDADEKAA